MKLSFVVLLLSFTSSAYAGNQQYEKLKDETKQMMSRMVSDQPPKVTSFDSKQEEEKWIRDMNKHLNHFVKSNDEAATLLKAVHYEAERAGLNPELILGLMQVESGFKKYALSSVGARGYMQVMPFWTQAIGDSTHDLFHLRTNLRYGCTILRHYLDIEHGNLFRALGRYNGSTGQPQYPNAVTSAMRQFLKEKS
jgi:soluble lytic murein transglycosylase-like protein